MAIDEAFVLGARFSARDGVVPLTGVQALIRGLVGQLRQDHAFGIDSACLASGYPGSPLGGFDRELARQARVLEDVEIQHVSGVNEELAATAVWGTQLVQGRAGSRVSSVIGAWYGKGPGLDRASDAIRHAQFVGTSPLGGVVAFVGDDPDCKSSSIPHSSDLALRDLGLPTLCPGDPQDALELTQHAVQLSRMSGLWTAVRVVAGVADGFASVDITTPPDAEAVISRVLDHARGRNPVLGIPGPPWSKDVESEIFGARMKAAADYCYRFTLNVVKSRPGRAWAGIIAVGHAYQELVTALGMLGETVDTLAEAGIAILHLRVTNPVIQPDIVSFGSDLERLLVLEDKRPNIETEIRSAFFQQPRTPQVWGKLFRPDDTALPVGGSLDPEAICAELMRFAAPRAELRRVRTARAPLTLFPVERKPYFCSGCPHNSVLKAPPGATIGSGIGCSSIAQTISGERGTSIETTTHMGCEGAQWIGLAPFTANRHVFQNMGDGTFFHSGQLAVQAAVAAGLNITYKLLFNGVIAMTGGQSISSSGPSAIATARHLLDLGVKRVAITTDRLERYRHRRLPRSITVHDRRDSINVQEELSHITGVTVLINDQHCAAELRRARKRGHLPQPVERIEINQRVCEGCGDCAQKSSCLSVEPILTTFGPRTRIDQASCNIDLSCVEGDCPSFVKIVPRRRGKNRGVPAREAKVRTEPDLPAEPQPQFRTDRCTLRLTGIGGTGVTTISQILAVAARLDGVFINGLDQTGLSQKAGPVISDLTFSSQRLTESGRIAPGEVDVYLGFDAVVAAAHGNFRGIDPERTHVVMSSSDFPTGEDILGLTDRPPGLGGLRERLAEIVPQSRIHWTDTRSAAETLLGDGTYANMYLLGAAYQLGLVPVSAGAIERAIELGGIQVVANQMAFRYGRSSVIGKSVPRADANRDRTRHVPKPNASWLAVLSLDCRDVIDHRYADLVQYMNARYADSYLRLLAKVAAALETGAAESERLITLCADNLYRVLAYKDEYEVARLLLDNSEAARLREAHGADAKVVWLLHPPILRALGRKKKVAVGPWFRPALVALRRARFARGHWFDVFGMTHVRRAERWLARDYASLLDALAECLPVLGLEVALEVAGLPATVVGYESIKMRGLDDYRARARELRTRYPMLGERSTSCASSG